MASNELAGKGAGGLTIDDLTSEQTLSLHNIEDTAGGDLLRMALSSTGVLDGAEESPGQDKVDDVFELGVKVENLISTNETQTDQNVDTKNSRVPASIPSKLVAEPVHTPSTILATSKPPIVSSDGNTKKCSNSTPQLNNQTQTFTFSQPLGGATPLYITTASAATHQIPQTTAITLAPISSTLGNRGTTGATVATAPAGYQIFNQPQIIQISPSQLISAGQIGINGLKTDQIIYGNQFANQFVLQPLNIAQINQPHGNTASPRVIRLQSTPSTFSVVNNASPSVAKKVQRRQSLQPNLSTASSNTIISPSMINSTSVPHKTPIHHLVQPPQPYDLIRKIENDHTLSAREKLIKIRHEMKRRYDMVREASDMKRDETFQKYRAAKIKGRAHPDPVIESMALASVVVPDVTMKFDIPKKLIVDGKLSDLQLEAIMYSKQQHQQYYPSGERKGFLLGDGAGVGKGRTIAGIILDNWNQGRTKAIWLSVSNDLRQDAQRDLKDINATNIAVHAFHKFKYGAKISEKENGAIRDGVIFGTYASLIGERHHDRLKTTKMGKILKTNQATRLHQLLTWCGTKFDGLIIFDECHKAKNLYQANGKPSKTGHTVLELQKSLKHARVVYASATGASEPKHMSYMSRIGLWGAGTGFKNSDQFVDALTKAGVGAMELVAIDMKRRGVYLARQLSFQGCSFDLEEVALDATFINMYDKCVSLWRDAKDYFQRAAVLLGEDFKMPGMWQQFWAAHQRFFKYLCMSAKVPRAVKLARQAAREGKCVIIGLQSTGEQRTIEEIDRKTADGEEITEMISSCKGVFKTLLERHFPVSDRSKLASLGFDFAFNKDDETNGDDELSADYTDPTIASDDDDEEDVQAIFGDAEISNDLLNTKRENFERKRKRVDSMSEHFKAAGFKLRKTSKVDEKLEQQEKANQECTHLLRTLLDKLDKLSPYLPGNALDELMDGLGGPEMVAEMTGRRNRLVITDAGVKYENRAGADGVPLENINLIEKEHFMQGNKSFAVISDAASSGISLHADRRVPNLKRRVHITLELPWSADKAVQQFGRSHRSNQVTPPEYVFLISELAGEQRFASVVARRLESMGALTHGDRHSTEKQQDLSKFNFDTSLGKKALDVCLRSILGEQESLVQVPSFYSGKFKDDMRRALLEVGIYAYKDDEKKRIKIDGDIPISKFLNRLLGLEMAIQQGLFQYFSDTLDDIIDEAKANGTYEEGILDVGNANDKVEVMSKEKFSTSEDTFLELVKIHDYRGVEWEEAKKMKENLKGVFYINKSFTLSYLLYPKADKYVCIRPNHSIVENSFDLEQWKTQLNLNSNSTEEDEVSKLWKDCYRATTNSCIHEYEKGTCQDNSRLPGSCMIGKRCLEIYLLCGPILSVWSHIQDIINKYDKSASIQVVRLKTSKGKRLVGLLIPNNCVEGLGEGLAKLERNRPKIRGPKRKYRARDQQLPTDLNSAQTEAELERLAQAMFEGAEGEDGDKDIDDYVENMKAEPNGHDGKFNGVDDECESDTEPDEDLDPDQEAELKRLAEQVIMENGFSF